MLLVIDTSTADRMSVALASIVGVLVSRITQKTAFDQSRRILPSIEKILQKKKVSLKKLTGIVVVNGPGGFTSLRVGVTTANALGYGLGIPVVGLSHTDHGDLADITKQGAKELREKRTKQSIAIPQYGSEPTITKPKPRQY